MSTVLREHPQSTLSVKGSSKLTGNDENGGDLKDDDVAFSNAKNLSRNDCFKKN